MKIINFKTAEIAKENGFKEETFHYYTRKGELKHRIEDSGCNEREYYFEYDSFIENWNDNVLYQIEDGVFDRVTSAPYQNQIVDWLRKEHNLFIYIAPYFGTEYEEGIQKWDLLSIVNLETEDRKSLNIRFESFEDCLEYGIAIALTMI